MLYMIGYDLRIPQYYKALKRAVKNLVDAEHADGFFDVSYGPCLVWSELGQEAILKAVKRELRAEDWKKTGRTARGKKGIFNDKLLVIPIGRNPHHQETKSGLKDWFAKNEVRPPEEREGDHLLAIAYTLHHPDSKFYDEVRAKLWKSFATDCTNPVHALWMVRTGWTAREAYTRLQIAFRTATKHREQRLAPNDKRQPEFDLLVIELERGKPLSGIERMRRDPVWLWEKGVDSEHVMLEDADPRVVISAPAKGRKRAA